MESPSIFFAKLCEKYHADKLNLEVWLKSLLSTTSLDIYSVETQCNRRDSIHLVPCSSQLDFQRGQKRNSGIFWFSSELI